MTVTKTKPTKTREEELAEQLEGHRAQMAELEQKASELDQAAAELDVRAEAKITRFDGPVTELPKGIDDDRGLALLKRQRAADLRTRAQAYAAKVELATIAAEHEQLRQERIAAEQLEAATIEAKALTAELDSWAAWLYHQQLAAAAIRAAYLEGGNRLMDLARANAGLGVDAARYTNLAVRAQELASQHQQFIAASRDPLLWRRFLPEFEPQELPDELRAPLANIAPATNQPRKWTGMVFGVRPSTRNPDGTAVGAVADPFNSARQALVPLTEAEERAKGRKLAAARAAEDGA
jgi:hypothetical protein